MSRTSHPSLGILPGRGARDGKRQHHASKPASQLRASQVGNENAHTRSAAIGRSHAQSLLLRSLWPQLPSDAMMTGPSTATGANAAPLPRRPATLRIRAYPPPLSAKPCQDTRSPYRQCSDNTVRAGTAAGTPPPPLAKGPPDTIETSAATTRHWHLLSDPAVIRACKPIGSRRSALSIADDRNTRKSIIRAGAVAVIAFVVHPSFAARHGDPVGDVLVVRVRA